MQSLPTNIYSVAAVREIDRIAIEDSGIPGYTLMTRAGEAAVRLRSREISRSHAMADRLRRRQQRRRWLRRCAFRNAGRNRRFRRDPVAFRHASGRCGESVRRIRGGRWGRLPWTGELDAKADLIVDAILGSGLARDLGGTFAAAADAINAHPAAVHAMDIASGINGDTGAVMGSCCPSRT